MTIARVQRGATFGKEIGLMDGGYYEIQNFTVTTYDSAYNHMDLLGNRWVLIKRQQRKRFEGK